jgi:hypothetical protein
MWTRLDDSLIDHSKVCRAGQLLGKNGMGMTIGFFSVALMWTNKHLTDGFLPGDVVKQFPHFEKPLALADALSKAGLLEKVDGGFQIHDFGDFNVSAAKVKRRRKEDRERKRNGK